MSAGAGARREAVARAVSRIRESRQSHVDWAEHIPGCAHCSEHGPPEYVQSVEEHLQIVAEYGEVLEILEGLDQLDRLALDMVRERDHWRYRCAVAVDRIERESGRQSEPDGSLAALVLPAEAWRSVRAVLQEEPRRGPTAAPAPAPGPGRPGGLPS